MGKELREWKYENGAYYNLLTAEGERVKKEADEFLAAHQDDNFLSLYRENLKNQNEFIREELQTLQQWCYKYLKENHNLTLSEINILADEKSARIDATVTANSRFKLDMSYFKVYPHGPFIKHKEEYFASEEEAVKYAENMWKKSHFPAMNLYVLVDGVGYVWQCTLSSGAVKKYQHQWQSYGKTIVNGEWNDEAVLIEEDENDGGA